MSSSPQPTFIIRVGNRIKEFTPQKIVKKLKTGYLTPENLVHNRDGIWRTLQETPGFRSVCKTLERKQNNSNVENNSQAFGTDFITTAKSNPDDINQSNPYESDFCDTNNINNALTETDPVLPEIQDKPPTLGGDNLPVKQLIVEKQNSEFLPNKNRFDDSGLKTDSKYNKNEIQKPLSEILPQNFKLPLSILAVLFSFFITYNQIKHFIFPELLFKAEDNSEKRKERNSFNDLFLNSKNKKELIENYLKKKDLNPNVQKGK